MKPLKMFLFGVPRLEQNGEAINITRRKVVALMAYLAVAGQQQSRDALAALLWPEHDQSSAKANLRRELSRLKRLMGEEHLKVDRYQAEVLRSPNLWLDVTVFANALDRARQHHPTTPTTCENCAAALAEAVALYQNDFMAGFALPDSVLFDDWQFFQAEGLRQQLSEALQLLIDWHVSRAEYERAVGYGRRWVALDALHEPAQRRLMQLYAWSGQHVAAMRQYVECARLLEEELGIAPEAETEALYEAIRSRQLVAPKTRTGPKGKSPEGRYEILDLLAVGGHAEVYHGCDRESGAEVVIKRLKPELVVKDSSYLDRFIREGTALGRLEHPNIVRMLATFEEEGQYSIVMEYVSGGSLGQLLDREGPLQLEKTLDIALELADALARAHHLNIIHRDLKPDNVLLAADGTPRLTDFGLARLRRDDVRLTRTGAVMGSPAYMSPEALRGEELDARSDIWSFGVLLYEILADRKPFAGQQLTPVLVSILQDEAPQISEFRPDIPPPLADLLQRMLQKEPDRRPASMRQVGAELEAIRAGATERLFLAPVPPGHTKVVVPQESETRKPVATASREQAFEERPSRFVGRREALNWLEQVLDASIAGNAGVAFVTGEAGQGKTSLLKAFVRQVQQQYPDLLVAGGNCNAYTGSGDPYLPFREILEMLTGDVEAHAAGAQGAEHARRLQSAVPRVLQALVETGPDLLDTFVPAHNLIDSAAALPDSEAPWRSQLQLLAMARARQRESGGFQQSDLFEQYARVLQALSRNEPLLLVLDDLQWADQGSANLLLHLGRRMQGYPIMILGAYRPADVAMGRDGTRHPLEAVIYELQRVFGEITLDLSQEEGRAFVDSLLDSEPNRLDETFRKTLFKQTGGHALFTIELLRGMQERGDLAKDDEGRWAAQPEMDWNTLPARVEGAIAERISRLSPALQELLEIASVEGEEFTVEMVARVLGKDERSTVRQFSSQLDRDHLLVRPSGTTHAGKVRLSRYRFRHILIQRYLYNRLDAVELVYQHEAVGKVLEELYGEEAALIAATLARHFELAEMSLKAAVYLQQAGDQARRAIALEQAARYFQAALERLPVTDPAGRATILHKIGECQWIMGDLQEALATYEACYTLFESTGDLQGAGAVQRSVGRLYWEIGNRERSLHHYHRSLETLEQIDETVELAWTLSSISQMHMLASQYDETIEWGERAMNLAQQLQADEVATHALNTMGVAYMETGQLERGKEMVRESLRRALALGLPHDACRAYLNLGIVPAGSYEERRAILTELLAYATSIRAPLYAGSAQIELGSIEWQLGEWRAAQARRPEIQRWMERAPSIGYLRGISSVFFGILHNDLGQFAKALEALEVALNVVRSQNEVQIIGPHLGQMARALAGQGREQEAVVLLQEMLEAISAQPYIHRDSAASLLFACNWLARRQPVPNSLEIAGRCHDLLRKADAYEIKPDIGASHLEAGGALLLAQKQPVEAAAQLEQAAWQWRELGRPYDEARVLISLGQALQQTHDAAGKDRAMERAAMLLHALAVQLENEKDKESLLDSPPLQAIGDEHPAALSRMQTAAAVELVEPLLKAVEAVQQEGAKRPRHNLPFQSTPLVGRQDEIAEIQRILAAPAGHRLLTLMGPGGIGKTRLALAAAAALVPSFADGVFFVPLAPLSSAEHIVSALAESLSLTPHEKVDPRQQLLKHLYGRQVLLLIDNFEHLLEGAELVAEILEQTPRVKIIVTSRERLNLSQETLYAIGSLDCPPQPAARAIVTEERLRQHSAIDLLLQRARMVAPGLTFEEKDLREAVRICHLVQGMPLALVLAAGWLELLTFKEIAVELSQSLALLESSARDLPERQRSVHAAFDYSWKRLAPEARQAFMGMSVFRGGFSRQAAQVVAGATLHTMRTLANKSFITADRKGRFEIHEVLRQLGLEQLQSSGETAAVRQAHSDYYLTTVHELEPDLRGGRQLEALQAMEIELENIRSAWQWALQQQSMERLDAAVESVFIFTYSCSRYSEGIELLQAARDQLAPGPGERALPLWGRVAARLAFLRAHATPGPELIDDIEQGLALATQNEDRREIAFGLLAQGCIAVYVNRDWQKALPLIESSLNHYQALEDHFYVVLAQIWLGYCHGNVTGLDNFNRYMREALALAQATGNKIYGSNATSNLAAGAFCEGDYAAARRYSHEALEVGQEMSLRLAMAHSKVQIGLFHFLNGNVEMAANMAREGLQEAREINYATTISYALSIFSLCTSLRGDHQEGRRLAEEALATPSPIFGRILAEWATAVAACGLQDWEAAWQHAKQSVRSAQEAGYPGMTTWALPIMAATLAERKETERAVALLALAKEHPLSPSAWMQQSASLARMQGRLLQEMGEEAYRAAWERGRVLEPGAIIGKD